MKRGREMESQLFRISSRARAGVGEAPREVSTREMIGLEARRILERAFCPELGRIARLRVSETLAS